MLHLSMLSLLTLTIEISIADQLCIVHPTFMLTCQGNKSLFADAS